ncbi:MAG TPA: hypothetical protein VFY87_03435 [Geminicoccaceae bacterium]|nr:hypothetical protein [Geminicoccaceae bacterium]
MSLRVLALAPFAVAAFLPCPAPAAERPCAQTDRLSELLDRGYGEMPMSTGLQQNGQLLQIYASPTTRTWTAVTTTPQGVSCVLATGQRWGDDGSGEKDVAAR